MTIFALYHHTILTIDKSRINLRDRDSILVPFDVSVEDPHRILFDFDILPNENYQLDVFPGAITDFFDEVNDSYNWRCAPKNLLTMAVFIFNL